MQQKNEYNLVNNDQELKDIIDGYRENIIALDIETAGEDPLNPWRGQIRLLQVATPGQPVLLVDWFQIADEGKLLVKNLLESGSVKVLHNARFDMKFLAHNGINLMGPIFDTYLAAGVLTSGLEKVNLKLEAVVKDYLGLAFSKDQQTSNWGQETLTPAQLKYAAQDVAILLPLRTELISCLNEAALIETAKLEFDILPAIVDMELNGIGLNIEKMKQLKFSLEEQLASAKDHLQESLAVDVNPNSPRQLLEALRNNGVNVDATNQATLSKLAPRYAAVRNVLNYKNIAKKSQFANKIPQNINSTTGRIHSNYFQLGTATGRLSCKDFNLQQVPKGAEFRDCFVPDKGNVFTIADYSQMQIRIAAELSRDAEMMFFRLLPCSIGRVSIFGAGNGLVCRHLYVFLVLFVTISK